MYFNCLVCLHNCLFAVPFLFSLCCVAQVPFVSVWSDQRALALGSPFLISLALRVVFTVALLVCCWFAS